MNTYEEEKNKLLTIMEQFHDQVLMKIPDSMQAKAYCDLLNDIKSDFYTIVVLGEFKRGKSTFINALLGEELLPVGVTPTTATINALMWGQKRNLSVCRTDGSTTFSELSAGSLNEFVAKTNTDFDAIKYIKLELPADILKNRVVVVDTPGIDDLNEHRVEVTYSFIPRADAVIFLLDATSPVRQTEKEFLDGYVLKNGIDHILFLANFMDQVDEEEKADVLESANRRLSVALPKNDKEVLPISAYQALTAKLTGDGNLLNESGLIEAEAALKDLIEQGSKGMEKLSRFKFRFVQILDASRCDISTMISLQDADHSTLSQQLENIEEMLGQGEKRRRVMEDYIEDREREMQLILKKSMNYFSDNLKEVIFSAFDDCKEQDLKPFIEKKVPKLIKQALPSWIDQYSWSINAMFEMLKRELALGLAREFNTSVNKLVTRDQGLLVEIEPINIQAADITNSELMAGLIAGGIGIAIMAVGIPIWPIVALAGFPLLRKQLSEKQTKSAKEAIRPELEQALNEVLDNFQGSVEAQMLQTSKGIGEAALDRYDIMLETLHSRIKNELTDRQKQKSTLEEKKSTLVRTLQVIDSLQEQVIALAGIL